MSARLAYKNFEAQELVVAECRRRIDGWRIPHELRVVQTALGPTTVLVAGGPRGVNGRSRPVLVLPGADLAAAALLPLAASIARTRQVLVVDPPGHAGLSFPRRPNHFGAYAGWLDELLTTLDRRPTVVGHAWGAAAALLATPDHIADLVLVNPAGVVRAQRVPSVTLAELRWRVQPAPHTARNLAQSLADPFVVVGDETVAWLELVASHARPSAAPAPLGAEVLARWAPRAGDVRILAGVSDPRFPVDRLVAVTTRHGLSTTVVQGTGHLMPDERPEAIAAALV